VVVVPLALLAVGHQPKGDTGHQEQLEEVQKETRWLAQQGPLSLVTMGLSLTLRSNLATSTRYPSHTCSSVPTDQRTTHDTDDSCSATLTCANTT
jgi:hypothetical protein